GCPRPARRLGAAPIVRSRARRRSRCARPACSSAAVRETQRSLPAPALPRAPLQPLRARCAPCRFAPQPPRLGPWRSTRAIGPAVPPRSRRNDPDAEYWRFRFSCYAFLVQLAGPEIGSAVDVSITVGNVGDEACVTKLGKDSCARHESETNHVVQVGAQLVPVLRGPVLMRPRVAERR